MSDDEPVQEVAEEEAPKPSKKKAAKKAEKKSGPSGYVLFRSRLPEAQEFEVCRIRASRNASHPGFCEWRVPAAIADGFAEHFHVQRGRIIRVD